MGAIKKLIEYRIKNIEHRIMNSVFVIHCSLFIIHFFILNSAMAEDIFSLYNYQYNLKPGITIRKPIISYEQDLSTSTNIRVSFTRDEVDLEKSNVDSVSGASKLASGTEVWDDIRNEFTVSVTQLLGDYKVEAGYYHSRETDYLSQTPSLSVSRDFFNRNTTLKFGVSHSFDQTFGHYMSGLSKDKDTDNLGLSLTQVFTPTTVGQIGYTYSSVRGYMPSGNRKVSVTGSSTPFDEYMPDTRKREGAGLRIAQYLPINSSIQLSYRWYRDTWSISSDTVSAQYFQYLLPNLIARLEYRAYKQSGAFFYKNTYSGVESFLTSTNIYAPFDSTLLGAKLSYQTSGKLKLKFGGLYERYTQSIGLSGDIYMLDIGFMF